MTTVEAIVVVVLFVIGMASTVRRYASHDRTAFAIVAILSPILMVFATFRTMYLILTGNLSVTPCPPGLEEAELLVEQERQKMFGGEARTPTFSASWKLAYDSELQRDADRVQRMAVRYLQHAH
jgi:hypothetical protein